MTATAWTWLLQSLTFSALVSHPPLGDAARQRQADVTTQNPRSADIAQSFRAYLLGQNQSEKNLKTLLRLNQKGLTTLRKDLGSDKPMELDNPISWNKFLAGAQLSILSLQVKGTPYGKKITDPLSHWMNPWMQRLARLPFAEPSLVSIKGGHFLRSLFLGELGRRQFQGETLKDLHWCLNLRAPWPLDRVVVTELRRFLPPKYFGFSGSLAKSIQRDPYNTSAWHASKLGMDLTGNLPEHQLIRGLWTEKDIANIKSEMTALGRIKMAAAAELYARSQNRSPATVADLVRVGLLSSTPIDFNSGKPIPLPTSPLRTASDKANTAPETSPEIKR